MTWTSTISWTTVAGPDGYAHIVINVVLGSSSESYNRTINVKTNFPNSAATPGPIVTVPTSTAPNGSGTVAGTGQWVTSTYEGWIWYEQDDGHLGAYLGYITVSYWYSNQGPGDGQYYEY